MRMQAHLSLALVTLIGGMFAGCGEQPVPERVTYAHDIKPLMEARCIRCHGAGQMLNDDPDSVKTLDVTKPNAGDFTGLENGPAGNGLLAYTVGGGVLMKAYILSQKDPKTGATNPPLMPPSPAPQLTSREREMLLKWLANPLPM